MKKFIAAVFAVTLTACAATQPLPHRDPSTSWDQATLKINDHGCPSAIFVAPGGDLVQCELPKDKTTESKDGMKLFPTMDAAAMWVVGKIYEHSHYYEYGGVIGRSPQGFVLSMPHTLHHGTDVNINEDPESYKFPIVATYHVHPCLKDVVPSVFSPQDLAGARATNHPAYVLDECTGSLHYWAPGDGYMDEAALLKLGIIDDAQISFGKIIGKITVDGVVLN